jgi:hypothetical protein
MLFTVQLLCLFNVTNIHFSVLQLCNWQSQLTNYLGFLLLNLKKLCCLLQKNPKDMLCLKSLAPHMNHETVLCDPYKNQKNLKRDIWTQSVIFERKVWFLNAKFDLWTQSVISILKVWLQQAREWFQHATVWFKTQSVIFQRSVNLTGPNVFTTRTRVIFTCTRVIFTRKVQFLPTECEFTHNSHTRVKFWHECVWYDTHECDNDTFECDFYTLSVISTRRV